jgi:hypothetical protein
MVWVHTPTQCNWVGLHMFPYRWWNTECFNKIFKAFKEAILFLKLGNEKLWIQKKFGGGLVQESEQYGNLNYVSSKLSKILEFVSRRKFEMFWIHLPPKVTSVPHLPHMQNFSM